ncbi:hypothetical protein ACN38_g6731 [Penicillium nordicum]|uniref:Uncharacterized protein n=1 Tax=Penicillium nordicum TaxID=229535 RepID=A0A0M9WF77_9EURO|nr:hypothetical protein ACN38_g6731 [Penicillium nordicum]
MGCENDCICGFCPAESGVIYRWLLRRSARRSTQLVAVISCHTSVVNGCLGSIAVILKPHTRYTACIFEVTRSYVSHIQSE